MDPVRIHIQISNQRQTTNVNHRVPSSHFIKVLRFDPGISNPRDIFHFLVLIIFTDVVEVDRQAAKLDL